MWATFTLVSTSCARITYACGVSTNECSPEPRRIVGRSSMLLQSALIWLSTGVSELRIEVGTAIRLVPESTIAWSTTDGGCAHRRVTQTVGGAQTGWGGCFAAAGGGKPNGLRVDPRFEDTPGRGVYRAVRRRRARAKLGVAVGGEVVDVQPPVRLPDRRHPVVGRARDQAAQVDAPGRLVGRAVAHADHRHAEAGGERGARVVGRDRRHWADPHHGVVGRVLPRVKRVVHHHQEARLRRESGGERDAVGANLCEHVSLPVRDLRDEARGVERARLGVVEQGVPPALAGRGARRRRRQQLKGARIGHGVENLRRVADADLYRVLAVGVVLGVEAPCCGLPVREARGRNEDGGGGEHRNSTNKAKS
eukprot:6289657-Prymnesium_polylepis.1